MLKNVGIGKATPLKADHFSKIIFTHTKIVKNIISKWSTKYPIDDNYWYIDLNAGPGVVSKELFKEKYGENYIDIIKEKSPEYNGEDIFCSPISFIKNANKNKINYNAFLIEKDPFTTSILEGEIAKCKVNKFVSFFQKERNQNIKIFQDDYSNVIKEITKKIPFNSYGSLYSDENGNVPPFELFKELSLQKNMRRIDFIIYCSSTIIKRTKNSKICKNNKTLLENITDINKNYWIVREPIESQQFTFLIGTNWDAFPQFENIGFYNIYTKEGQEILRKINMTKEEVVWDRYIKNKKLKIGKV